MALNHGLENTSTLINRLPSFCLCMYICRRIATRAAAVALNGEQYGDSLMCGACLVGTANGNGAGADPIPATYRGFITDR